MSWTWCDICFNKKLTLSLSSQQRAEQHQETHRTSTNTHIRTHTHIHKHTVTFDHSRVELTDSVSVVKLHSSGASGWRNVDLSFLQLISLQKVQKKATLNQRKLIFSDVSGWKRRPDILPVKDSDAHLINKVLIQVRCFHQSSWTLIQLTAVKFEPFFRFPEHIRSWQCAGCGQKFVDDLLSSLSWFTLVNMLDKMFCWNVFTLIRH